jgi:hypothetical protein
MRLRALTAILGEGRGDSRPPSPAASTFEDTQGFAPRGPSTLQSRIRDRLPQPLRIHTRHGSIARIHTACSVLSPVYYDSVRMVTNWNAEGGQLQTRTRRQRTLPRTVPLPHRRFAAVGGAGRPARILYPQLRDAGPARLQDRDDKPHWRSTDGCDCLHTGLAGALVATPVGLQQGEDAASGAGPGCSGHGCLYVHAPTMAAVSEAGGSGGRIRLGREPASFRGLDVICARIDPRGGAGFTGLPTVRFVLTDLS